jgi:hypothetical protein
VTALQRHRALAQELLQAGAARLLGADVQDNTPTGSLHDLTLTV